jgi:hypothetical protein
VADRISPFRTTGIGFDLRPVEAHFKAPLAGPGLSHRLSFQGGDFFTDPLPRADVIVMGHVLHDWDLEERKLLIRKAYDTLPLGGALIVYDAIIDQERRQNAFGLLMSLNMLIETPGGADYTGAQCSAWMREAGFRQIRSEHLLGPDSMVVGSNRSRRCRVCARLDPTYSGTPAARRASTMNCARGA